MAIQDQLSQQHCEQMPVFLELARRLTARFPCLTTPDAPGEHGAWSDGPLDGETNEPIYGLGVSTDLMDIVVPFVVETAKDLRLVVFDEQSGVVFLPDGTRIPNSPPPAPKSASPDLDNLLVSRPQFARILRGGLRDLMNANGYQDFDAFQMFTRDHPLFSEVVQLSAGSERARYDVGLTWTIKPRLPDELLGRLEQRNLSYTEFALNLWVLTGAKLFNRKFPLEFQPLRSQYDYKVFWVAKSVSHLNETIRNSIAPTIREKILPLVEGLSSHDAIDRMAYPVRGRPSPICTEGHALILSWLAGRTDLQERAKYLKENTTGFLTTKVDEYLEVLEGTPR